MRIGVLEAARCETLPVYPLGSVAPGLSLAKCGPGESIIRWHASACREAEQFKASRLPNPPGSEKNAGLRPLSDELSVAATAEAGRP